MARSSLKPLHSKNVEKPHADVGGPTSQAEAGLYGDRHARLLQRQLSEAYAIETGDSVAKMPLYQRAAIIFSITSLLWLAIFAGSKELLSLAS